MVEDIGKTTPEYEALLTQSKNARTIVADICRKYAHPDDGGERNTTALSTFADHFFNQQRGFFTVNAKRGVLADLMALNAINKKNAKNQLRPTPKPASVFYGGGGAGAAAGAGIGTTPPSSRRPRGDSPGGLLP